MIKIGNKLILWAVLFLSCPYNLQASEIIRLKKVSDKIYVIEDFYYIKENSIIYIGDEHVSLIGATWSPETAKRVAEEIRKITTKPIREVVNTDYQPDRSGGNSFWKAQGAKIISTQLTHDIMSRQWAHIVTVTQSAFPSYPKVPLTLPDKVYPGDFQLQNGKVRGLYLGPSHSTDGIFVYFPQEKVLYGGCILVEHVGIGYLGDSNLMQYPKTLSRLKNLNLEITHIITGHGDPVHGEGLLHRHMMAMQEHINKNF